MDGELNKGEKNMGYMVLIWTDQRSDTKEVFFETYAQAERFIFDRPFDVIEVVPCRLRA